MKPAINIVLILLWSAVAVGWLLPPAVQLAKAELAQRLIPHAWQQTLQSGRPHKPWPWADTWPVAKLSSESGQAQYVLSHAAGQSLAFGPSMLPLSAKPNGLGTVAVAAHRDTHFAFLQHSQLGDHFALQRLNGVITDYQVVHIAVVDSRDEQLYFQSQSDELKLITCYPFDALAPRGPLRYVVTAIPV